MASKRKAIGKYAPKHLVETTEEYLRRGGIIRRIPMGVSGLPSNNLRQFIFGRMYLHHPMLPKQYKFS